MAEVVEEENDGFADGFNSVAGNPVAEKETPAPVVEAKEETPEPEKEPDKTEEPEILGHTPAEIKAILAKASEVDALKSQMAKLNGHIGNMLQQVKALKEPKSDKPPLDVEKFDADYGDFVTRTNQEIEKRAATERELTRQEVKEALQAQELLFEERMLARDHPDWSKTVNSDGYKVWLQTRPPEYQQKAENTISSVELGAVISAYKDFGKKSDTAKANKERVVSALVPSGVTPPRPAEPTEDDAFRAGFKAVASNRQ